MPDRLRVMFERAGAEWLDLPILQPADPFLETAGEDVRRRMFVTEGPSGERLALRPDFTIPVCLDHLRRLPSNQDRAARYAYGGLVFRRHDDGAREQLECGFEDIGSGDTGSADADVIALAVSGLHSLDQRGLIVRFGDVGLFSALLKALALPTAWQQKLRRSYGVAAMMAENLDSLRRPRTASAVSEDTEIVALAGAGDRAGLIDYVKTLFADHGHLPGLGRSAEEVADRFLSKQALVSVQLEPGVLSILVSFLELTAPIGEASDRLNRFCEDHSLDLGEATENFARRAELLNSRVQDCSILFDAAFGRPLDYYTGLVFQIAGANGTGIVAGGGRYDRLLEMLGATTPVTAVGFTIDLGRLAGVAE